MRASRVWLTLSMALLLVTAPTLATADIITDLAAYWRLNEAGGSVANDEIGTYDANLTNTAAFVSDPQRGQVLSPGTGGALVSGGSPILADAGAIVGWVKLADTSGYNFFVDQVDYSVGSEPRIYMYAIEGNYRIGLGTTSSYVTSANFDTGNWHQIALSWEANSPGASSGAFTAYFDGVPVQGTAYNGFTSVGNYLSLGSQYYPPANVFGSSTKGSVSEYGVWHRALSDAEVLSIYQQGYILPAPEPGSLALLACGAIGLICVRIRRRALGG